MTDLWPHQQRGLTQLADRLAAGVKAVLLAAPTGAGKTRMIAEALVASDDEESVYTDRKMLFSQTGSVLERHGIRFGCRSADHEPKLLERVQLSMVQTETSRVLKGKRDVHAADRIWIDEAHKNMGPSMMELLALHEAAKPNCARVGVTATPLGIGHAFDELIVCGTNSELRACGALVPAHHYGPDEPDVKWIKKVKIDGGECGIHQSKRMEFAQQVFGSLVEHYWIYNPEQLPSICFAPDVKSGVWLAAEFTRHGITAAFISGEHIWLDGELHKNTQELRDEIAERHQRGDIKVVVNRFVLREGIDWPWVYHGIFATIFGSLTSYIQAGGRLLRAYPGKPHCVIQDHGGNWHRHGSLNIDRHWELADNDRTVAGVRADRIRTQKEPEPIVCPQCHAVRLSGPKCWECGFQYERKTRLILQKDGSLREMHGDIYRQRRYLNGTEKLRSEWVARIKAIQKSKKPTVQQMTFAQVEANFAREHNWKYPPRDWPMMPIHERDWYMPVREVTELSTGWSQQDREMAIAAADGW